MYLLADHSRVGYGPWHRSVCFQCGEGLTPDEISFALLEVQEPPPVGDLLAGMSHLADLSEA